MQYKWSQSWSTQIHLANNHLRDHRETLTHTHMLTHTLSYKSSNIPATVSDIILWWSYNHTNMFGCVCVCVYLCLNKLQAFILKFKHHKRIHHQMCVCFACFLCVFFSAVGLCKLTIMSEWCICSTPIFSIQELTLGWLWTKSNSNVFIEVEFLFQMVSDLGNGAKQSKSPDMLRCKRFILLHMHKITIK